ncbi:hypothetical protein [Streptomyces rubiginosohelvolus]|uniref:hypothetical protein n=1 Tax=Streptomyces rubiginosohelvolus TaxID=67362 RepID=UPI0033F72F2F
MGSEHSALPAEEITVHGFTVNYRKDHRRGPTPLLDRGYFLSGLPRLIALCQLLGHKPTIDGYDSKYGKSARWVSCARCGIRPNPQGRLDATQWAIGQRYTGPFLTEVPQPPEKARQLEDAKPVPLPPTEPGPWPTNPTSSIGAQLIIGPSFGGAGIELKVGSPASEQCLAAHVRIHPLGALYVHTENHGQFIQKYLNNSTDWESRVIGLSVDQGTLRWKVWARRDSSSIHDPWWMNGSINIDPRHYLLGPNRGHCTPLTEKTPGTVYLPDGTRHDITLTLERWTHGRTRGRKTTRWMADWTSRAGIPVRFDRSVHGASIEIGEEAAKSGQWAQQACAAIAAQCVQDRVRYGYEASAAA